MLHGLCHPTGVTVLAAASFDVVALIFGGLLVIGALASGIAHRSFLSLTAVFVLAGSCWAMAASACSTSFRPQSSCTTWRPSR